MLLEPGTHRPATNLGMCGYARPMCGLCVAYVWPMFVALCSACAVAGTHLSQLTVLVHFSHLRGVQAHPLASTG